MVPLTRTRSFVLAAFCLLGLPSVARAQSTESDAPAAGERYTTFRVGADLGYATINHENFFTVNATGLMRIYALRLDFWVPLNFHTTDFSLRQEDWQTAADYVRVARCLRLDVGDLDRPADTFDPNCDPYDWEGGLHNRTYLSARLSPVRGVDFGHGTLLAGFNNSIDPNNPQLGGRLDFIARDWGDAQFVLDDVLNPRILAGRVTLRPDIVLLGRNWDETPDDFQLGASVVGDLAAPLHVATAFGRAVLDGRQNLQFSTTHLTALNFDAHYWYQLTSSDGETVNRTRIMAYMDYNRFLEADSADAFHGGARFNWFQGSNYARDSHGQAMPGGSRFVKTWQFSAGVEARYMGGRYLPEYFDANYMVQSQQFALNQQTQAALGPSGFTTTKLEYLLAQPGGYNFGLQGYLQVVIPVPTASGQAPSPLPITLTAEDSAAPNSAAVTLTAGPYRMDQLLVTARFVRRNFAGLDHVASLDGAVIQVISQILLGNPRNPANSNNLLSNMALNFRYDRRFFLGGTGQYQTTDDFLVTLGTSTGIN